MKEGLRISTVVEHSTDHPKAKGSSPATAAGTRREKVSKRYSELPPWEPNLPPNKNLVKRETFFQWKFPIQSFVSKCFKNISSKDKSING